MKLYIFLLPLSESLSEEDREVLQLYRISEEEKELFSLSTIELYLFLFNKDRFILISIILEESLNFFEALLSPSPS